MLGSALGFVPLPLVVLIVLFLAGAAAGSQPAPAPAPDHCSSARSRSPMIAILVAMIAGITVVGGIACLYFRHQKESGASLEMQEMMRGQWVMQAFTMLDFSMADVVTEIENRRRFKPIATGGTASVYLIHLATGGCDEESGARLKVAMKVLQRPPETDRCCDAEELDKQFEAEANLLGKMQHINIVKLLCSVSGPEDKVLLYEYMEKGSLYRCLHDRPAGDEGAALDWPTRLAIAVDAARGLSYMHHDCEEPVAHLDVKSSNILLGAGFHAKIGDLGCAQTLGGQSVPAVRGTYGYMPPEITQDAVANVKLDVYSFGVVILELTTGKEAIIDRSGVKIGLVDWARQRYMELTTGKATLDNIVDEAIRNPTYMQAIQSVFILGVICTSQDPDKRPSMAQVLDQLNKCQCQCQQISAETTEAFQLGYDEGEGSSAPLLQRPRRTTAGSSFMRRQFSDLLRRSTAMITSSTTKRSTLSGRSSFKGLELLRRMHGTRAHTK